MSIAPASPAFRDLLSPIFGSHQSCILLDYPDHLNAGDHLIWLSTLQLLRSNQISLSYCASLVDFSPTQMERCSSDTMPILLQGGGNLGDLWPESQLFREKIIAQYRERPIVILPQSTYFAQSENAQRAADIFNSHPNLTILVRDQESFEIAASLFIHCRVILTPDMTLWPEAQFLASEHRTMPDVECGHVLFLRRQDAESKLKLHAADLAREEAIIEDWQTYNWAYTGRGRVRDLTSWYWQIPAAVNVYREVWQRGLSRPAQFLSRLKWENSTPLAAHLRELSGQKMHRFSLTLLHDALAQFKHCRLVVTDRLHGQIMAHILGVPSILLANAYHKNQSYYSTWMQKHEDCHFAASAEQLRSAIAQLIGSS